MSQHTLKCRFEVREDLWPGTCSFFRDNAADTYVIPIHGNETGQRQRRWRGDSGQDGSCRGEGLFSHCSHTRFCSVSHHKPLQAYMMGLYLCSTAWEHGRARLELGRRDNYATVRRGDGDLQKNRESKSHSRGNLEINPVLCTEGIASWD